METWIIILFIVVIAEMIMSGRWFPFYFRTGIPLYRRSFPFLEQPTISPETLSEEFYSSFADPLVFRAIGPREIGFREKLFSFRLFSYSPIMHGLIRIDQLQHKVSVTGYANWSIIVFTATFIAAPLYLQFLHLPVLFFLCLVLGILYLIQAVRFTKVFKTLEQKYKQGKEGMGSNLHS